MSNFEQFLGGSEKLGEVIPMVSSEMPYIFSASGGTYLRSGYTTSNTGGLYNTYAGLTHTGTVILPDGGQTSPTSIILKSGSNYISGKNYTTDLTGTWVEATGGTYTTNIKSSFIVGTTVVHTSTSDGVGMVEYSIDNGVTYTNVTGNNRNCTGAVNAAGNLALVIREMSGGTASGDIYTSTDGITWTARTPSLAVSHFASVIWSPALSAFVITADNGTYSTTDGFTLTLLSSGNKISLASSTTSLVSKDFLRSVDGVTWVSYLPPLGVVLYPATKVAYINSTYYAFGTNSVIYKSIDDGLTWERFFISFDDTYLLGYTPAIGWLDSALYLYKDGKVKTTPAIIVNGVMAKVKAEPTEGYAYVRIQ